MIDRRPTDRPRILENFERPYLGNGHPIHFMFGSRVGFSRSADRMDLYFQLDQIQDGGWPPSGKNSNGHISATDRPIDFVFDPSIGFSGTADRMDLLLVVPIKDSACRHLGKF